MRTFMMGLALAAGLGTALAGRTAMALDREIGDQPWFPIVDAKKGPDETFELITLAVIGIGDEGGRLSRGKYRESMTRHDFFVTIGRTDLATKDRDAATLSTAVTWAGIGAVGAGGLLTFAHLSPGGFNPPLGLGLGLGGAGVLAMLIGAHRRSRDLRRGLALG